MNCETGNLLISNVIREEAILIRMTYLQRVRISDLARFASGRAVLKDALNCLMPKEQDIEIRSSMTSQMLVAALFACSLLLSSYASPHRKRTSSFSIPLAPRTVVINRSGRDTDYPIGTLSNRLHSQQRNTVRHFNTYTSYSVVLYVTLS